MQRGFESLAENRLDVNGLGDMDIYRLPGSSNANISPLIILSFVFALFAVKHGIYCPTTPNLSIHTDGNMFCCEITLISLKTWLHLDMMDLR